MDCDFCESSLAEVKKLTAEAEQLRKKYEARQFPVIGKRGPSSVPWWWVMKHENSAKNQHSGQSIETLARRGGMSVSGLYFAMQDMEFPWRTAQGEWSEVERKALDWIATRPWMNDENMKLREALETLKLALTATKFTNEVLTLLIKNWVWLIDESLKDSK